MLVNPEYGNVPVCEPVNEPVNGEVKLLNCNDDDTVPVGNELTTCVELLTVPAGNAVEFNAYDAVVAYDADVPVNALNCVLLDNTPLNLFCIEL